MFAVNSEDDGNKRLSLMLILKFGLSWISRCGGESNDISEDFMGVGSRN
jgi:hypothetical protein